MAASHSTSQRSASPIESLGLKLFLKGTWGQGRCVWVGKLVIKLLLKGTRGWDGWGRGGGGISASSDIMAVMLPLGWNSSPLMPSNIPG